MNEKKADLQKSASIPYTDHTPNVADVDPKKGDSIADAAPSTDRIHTITDTHITQKLQRRSDALRENLLKRKQQMRSRT